jgi:hypothetical protein
VLGGFAAQMLRGHVSVNLAQNLVGGLAVGIAMSLMIRFVASLLAGFASEITVAFYQDHPVFEGVRGSIGSGYHFLNAFGGGLTALLFVELIGRTFPARGIRWSPRPSAWFFSGVICSVVTAIVAWTKVGALAGLAVGFAGIAASGLIAGVAESVAIDPAGAASPATVLRRDRMVFFASWLGLGVVLGSCAWAGAIPNTGSSRTSGRILVRRRNWGSDVRGRGACIRIRSVDVGAVYRCPVVSSSFSQAAMAVDDIPG